MSVERKLRVVAVDDDFEILMAVEQLLKDNSKLELVGKGNNGRDALQLCNRLKPDVAVLDVKMPVLNGLEAAARIRASFPDITVVMLTSETELDTVKEAMRAGATEFLSKVGDIHRLANAILDAHAKRTETTRAKGDAFFWGFYPTKGTGGATTLAVNTALYLTQLDYKVLLMDLDPVNGDCGFQLNVPPRQLTQNLLYLLGELEEFDSKEVERWIRRIPLAKRDDAPVLHLLDSPGTFVPPGRFIEQNFQTLLEFALKDYDYVIVDFGPGRVSEWMTAAVLDLAERLFVITTRDMSSVKSLQVLTNLMKESAFPIGKVSILLSQLCDQVEFDAKEHLTAEKLGVRDIGTVTLDRNNCSEASRLGKPLMLFNENAPLSRFVKHAVEKALNMTPRSGHEDPSVWSLFVKNFKKVLGFDEAAQS